MKRPLSSLLLLTALLAAACSGNDASSDDTSPISPANNSPDDTPDDTPNNDDPDAGVVEEDVEEEPAEPTVCDALELPAVEFDAGEQGELFGDLAGDFTVNTLDGPWTLSEAWTGCESYVFINYYSNLGDANDLWNSDVAPLLTEGPLNVHYFFFTDETQGFARTQRMTALRARFDEALTAQFPDEAQRAAQRARLHFVSDRLLDVAGGPGLFARAYRAYANTPEAIVDLGDRGRAPAPPLVAFGINRMQQWDAGGTMDQVVGQPPAFAMAAYLGHFYNHLADLRVRDEAEVAAGTQVFTLVDESVTERVFIKTATLPDADAMAAFDTLEFDVEVHCPHRNPFACSEWDRIARISMCLDGEACEDRREVVRWITPYWRRGTRRWFIEASPFLGLMRQGGDVSFRVEMGPGWERKTERDARITLRLSERGGEPRSQGVERVFTGGNFDASYNDNRPPVSFTVPGEATHVELVVLLSGHGQAAGNNCAEWCDHRHNFSLAGIPLAEIAPGPVTGTLRGCADRAIDGVPPGQWGNWAPGRAYWCPGMPVQPMRFDITQAVRLDANNILLYEGLFRDSEPNGGNISMSAYIVWYTD